MPYSKKHLHLPPHAPDAAVGKILVQITRRQASLRPRRVADVSAGHLHKLRMVESILSFPPELQTPSLSDGERFEQAQVEIICTAGQQSIPSHRGPVGKSHSLHPIHVG